MEIVKKIARYILRKELKLQEVAFETQKRVLIHDIPRGLKNSKNK